jgi:hypothetical protein
MSPSVLSAITIIGSILLVFLQAWQGGAPKRKEEEREAEIQAGRQAIAGGDVGAVNQRLDRVLTVQETGASGGAAGEHDPSGLLLQFAREEGVEVLPDRTGGASQTSGEG